MLHGSGLSSEYWKYAFMTANYLRNTTPTLNSKNKTPFEIIHNYKPDVSDLKVFGSNAWLVQHGTDKET
jgi:hypothetical protein